MTLTRLLVLPAMLASSLLAQPVNVEYRLTAWSESGQSKPLPAGSAITMKFLAEGLLGGSSGVNRYTGAYDLDASGKFEWKTRMFATTMMAGPEQLMQLEDAYLKALISTSRIQVEGSQLTLSTSDGATALTFSQAGDKLVLRDTFGAPQTLRRFVLDGQEVALPPTPVTLTLQREGRVSGVAAVNRFFGGFRLLGEDTIQLSEAIGTTRRAGPPELMQFDQQLLTALPSVRTIGFDSGLLILEGPGMRLEFAASEALE